jgi:lipopolysaccharide transport system ATP-binding protein
MSNIAIRAQHLGKQYRIGTRAAYGTFREMISAGVRAPINWLQGKKRNDSGHFWALEDISFEIMPGEVVGIIGHNGAGKSTLLKILSRITKPTKGRVELNGRVGSLLEVGTGFHTELSGRENIYLNGAILGMHRSEIDAKFDEIVDFAEVNQFLDTPVKFYSSGMYMRLAFAVAAHLEPEILLVDEVLAVGDAAFQKKCLGKMSAISKEGRTIIFVSHNMSAITSLCQRGLWIDKGRLVKDDTAESSVLEYLSSLRQFQTAQEGRVSLVGHPGRRKTMDQIVYLNECQILDENQNPVSRLKSGQSARIRLVYQMKQAIPDSPVSFVVALRNDQGQRIGYCSSDVSGDALNGLSTGGKVDCVIKKLPVYPGHYSIDVGCKVASSFSDFVYEAVEFDVVDGGFYPTKLLPPDSTGNFLFEYDWSAA